MKGVHRITVGLYVNLSAIRTSSLLDIRNGNPGIGGTQYAFLLLYNYLLERSVETGIIPVLYTENIDILPKSYERVLVSDVFEALTIAVENKDDFFVFRPIDSKSIKQISSIVKGSSIKLVSWMHNFLDSDTMTSLNQCECFYKNVLVSRGQLSKIYDEDIYSKSCFIYNSFYFNNSLQNVVKKENIVTYIGSIVPSKGFHILAKYWKDVLHAVPNAQLHVIGSGNLYNSDEPLGEFNIASASYERLFMPYLLDNKGRLLPSVFFHGKMGEEKKNIINSTSVGVANPSGKTETFGITAVEFQSCGVPVVACDSTGYQETIEHGITGYLFSSGKEMISYIVMLLRNETIQQELSIGCQKFVKNKFDIEQVGNQWISLFSGESFKQPSWVNLYITKYRFFQYVYLFNGILRNKLGLRFLPTIAKYTDVLKKLKNGK